MKRLALLLTMILAVALPGLVGGCGKSNAPEGRPAGALLNGAANDSSALTLGGGTNARQSLVAPDGTVYQGEVKDGKPNGFGTLTDTKGTYQKGEWRNGAVYRVSGTCVLPDRTKEAGTWNNDGTTCGGTIWFPDGRIYKGDWVIVDGKADLPYGMGAMSWPDGRQYAGHFVNGKMDGVGKMTYPNGKTEDGLWKQDAFVGPAK